MMRGMDWALVGAVAAVVVPVGALIVTLIVTLINRQIDGLRSENREAHAHLGNRIDDVRSDMNARIGEVRSDLRAFLTAGKSGPG